MTIKAITVTKTIGNQEVTIETGKIAKQANGSVLITAGGTVVLVAACAAKSLREGQDFFPLTVDYREKAYAAGRIPGGYFKREGKQTERETLVSRLTDRPLRPLFPEGYLNEVQVSATVLSIDNENNPDTLSMVGASAALLISDIPFHNAMAGVRVGFVDGQFVLNPSFEATEQSELELVLAGTEDSIVMIEAGAKEVSEEIFLKAIEFGHAGIREFVKLQKELAAQSSKTKMPVEKHEISKDIVSKVTAKVGNSFDKIFSLKLKKEKEEAKEKLYEEVLSSFDEKAEGFNAAEVATVFHSLEESYVRKLIVEKGKRPDGRGFQQIRDIWCEVGVLPRTHGSAIFTRGETQSLSVATLGSSADEQRIDALEGEQTKRFMLHYNFPSFSVGEVKPNRGPGRREIGHGALAERALKTVLPGVEEFPYTIRLVSEILESNGSSSMATVCGGTLALMDAGVPIKAPVSGIAMGLVMEGKEWKVLTDIAGIEDHLGDMDFKVAGTKKGITALQMDIKIVGVNAAILTKALSDAKEARLKILDSMLQAMPATRETLSDFAPRITTIKINPSKIGELIGPGGKNIKKIIAETGAKIDIQDDGTVNISSTDPKATEAAIERIKGNSQEAEVGKIYQGKVRKIMPFGAFCEILPGLDGLVHVSEVADGFVKKVEDHLKVGDIVTVKVTKVDENGKISLSIKQALQPQQPQ